MVQSEMEVASCARLAVLIPALDEEAALPHVLADLPRDLLDAIVVVDNGSRDRTAEVARAAGATVVSEPRKGYGRACLKGLALLLGGDLARGFAPLADRDIVVFLDGDRSDHAEELPSVVAPILAGRADLVIGSRVLGGASARALLPQARLGNALACYLMRVLFGAKHTDLGPFRAIRVDALKHLRLHDPDYGWTIEMQLKAHVAHLCVVEVPVRYRPRIGVSKVSGTVMGSLRAGLKILAWITVWRLKLCFPGRRIPRFHGSTHSGC